MSTGNVIVLTGGGTAGHVMPNLALVPELKKLGFFPHYIGSNGIESSIVKKFGLPFHEIATGKLRRYFSVKNFTDPLRVLYGFIQAWLLIRRLQPKVVFSKGGFVSVPVTVAAWCLRVPVVTHESDYSPGLANRMIAPFSVKILYTFTETGRYLPIAKSLLVGTPVRQELFLGDAAKGQLFCQFLDVKPVILVMGGSQGAQRINTMLQKILPDLVLQFNVVHLTGRGKLIDFASPSYRAFEYVDEELKDLLALATMVISRAGANSIFELLALRKPMLLIPLEVGSRGDQVLNARSFCARGWSESISESTLTAELLNSAIMSVFEHRAVISERQRELDVENVPHQIALLIEQCIKMYDRKSK